ncbi:hypothetical protein V5O48_014791 [Marasmius crinis-equi]|uniref:Uncharacterized protein n=1 Tax=Marasmius crinis-equi TaxID=585013 RepID=A0ABR3EWD7_9AGAR
MQEDQPKDSPLEPIHQRHVQSLAHLLQEIPSYDMTTFCMADMKMNTYSHQTTALNPYQGNEVGEGTEREWVEALAKRGQETAEEQEKTE